MKNNNKGFTLVELLVSTAIFGILALGISAFMISGARIYSDVNYSLRVQYQSQLTLNFLQEYIVDCTDGILVDGNEIYIINEDKTHAFYYDDTNDELYYATSDHTDGKASPIMITEFKDLVARNVTFFSLTGPVTEGSTQVEKAEEVELVLTVERGGKEYQASQKTALRNKPLFGCDWTTLYNELYPST